VEVVVIECHHANDSLLVPLSKPSRTREGIARFRNEHNLRQRNAGGEIAAPHFFDRSQVKAMAYGGHEL